MKKHFYFFALFMMFGLFVFAQNKVPVPKVVTYFQRKEVHSGDKVSLKTYQKGDLQLMLSLEPKTEYTYYMEDISIFVQKDAFAEPRKVGASNLLLRPYAQPITIPLPSSVQGMYAVQVEISGFYFQKKGEVDKVKMENSQTVIVLKSK